jgi:hypothetical protein
MSNTSSNLLSILNDLSDQFRASSPPAQRQQLMQINVANKCRIEIFADTKEHAIEIYRPGQSWQYLCKSIIPGETFEELLLYILSQCDDLSLPVGHHLYYRQCDTSRSISNITNKKFMKLPVAQIPISSGELIYKENHMCSWCSYTSKDIRKKCSSCKVAYYCDISCQKLDWREHKHHCFEQINSIYEDIN